VNDPLWKPGIERIRSTNMARFMAAVEQDWKPSLAGYEDLYRFSIDRPERFWDTFKDFAGVVAETWGGTVLANGDKMPGAQWFPDARLNFAENLLPERDDPLGNEDAIVFWGEDKARSRVSRTELFERVSSLSQALIAAGIEPGDRVAAYMPNMPETVIAMLAAASIGAVWSSCSPDFGVRGVLDRLGQIEPKVVFAVDGYLYNGKTHDCLGKLKEILAGLGSVEKTVIIPYANEAPEIENPDQCVLLEDFTSGFMPGEIPFVRLPFNHPLYIMYSSGTTGAPKCIVHGAGGTLLQHLKEHLLHCDAKPGDRIFYFTTCGWMMWNWMVSALAAGAALLLYDGSPFYPDGNVLFDFADAENMTFFGTSAKYIDALSKAGLSPAETHSLKALRAMASTGSPLAAESFDYVYANIKSDLHLASISGGTDIISCFVLGNPVLAVHRGEIQGAGLGMAVEVFDDAGKPVASVDGGKGELVCRKPFPSMPLGFWNDEDGAKYRAAYFERFPGVWHHGDYLERTAADGFIIHGRSDATLNPGGVRIGTAEIYRQVEQIDDVIESIVIGQEWDGDVRVVLFVRLREGIALDDGLIDVIKARIRANCTPRHVPAKIVQVADIPRTKSGKITELAVRDVVHGHAVKNTEALANPEALELYRYIEDLKS